MNPEIFRYGILLVSVICYLLIIITIPFRVKAILKKAGECVYHVKGKSFVIQILIIICCGAILALLAFRELGTIGDAIVCIVAILGAAMASEETGLYKHCGVYKNGIISGGHYLPISEIYSIPSLNLSEDERKSSSSVKIVTDKKGTVTFTYDSPEECNEVVQKIIELKPSLVKENKKAE